MIWADMSRCDGIWRDDKFCQDSIFDNLKIIELSVLQENF